MNPTAIVSYEGDLLTHATHVRSQTTIVTDAPVDNKGKGSAFSPTDLLATSLLTCMITTMGIAAQQRGIDMGKVSGEVEKIMASGPRRVAELLVHIHMTNHTMNAEQKLLMEQIAENCPVQKSIHPDIQVKLSFSYED